MTHSWARVRCAVVFALVLLGGASHAGANPVTLFSTLSGGNALDAGGWQISSGPLDPAHFGIKVHFTTPSPADWVKLAFFDSILIGLSTADEWSDAGPSVPMIHFGIFEDAGGVPAALVAGASVFWPLSSSPSLFPTDPGWPLNSVLLSTHQDYWFALSILEDPGPDQHTMTWHFADRTETPSLRLTGEAIPEPALSLLLAAGVAGAWVARRGRAMRSKSGPVV